MIENVFSSNDYNTFINKPDYDNLKIYYSKQILEKVKNKEIVFSKETMTNFDKIFSQIIK